MYDREWLSSLTETELLDVYDWTRTRYKELRRRHIYGFANWYAQGASEVIEELGRLYRRQFVVPTDEIQLTVEDELAFLRTQRARGSTSRGR